MQEFGDIRRYRDACEQLKAFRKTCAADLRAEVRRKKELEKEEQKMKELEEFKIQVGYNSCRGPYSEKQFLCISAKCFFII
jgi:hypothetical protein